MAPPDDREHTSTQDPPRRQQDREDQDHENPFIAFRKFADDTVAGMLQSFIGLPSTFSFPSTKERWRELDEQLRRFGEEARRFDDNAKRKTMESWGATTHGKKDDDHNEASRDRRELASGSGSGFAGSVPSTLASRTTNDDEVEPNHHGLCAPTSAYFPRELPLHSGCFQPWSTTDLRFSSPDNTCMPMRDWLCLYLKASPYSPVHLEQHPDLEHWGSSWRRAFEDLVGCQTGLDLKPKNAPRYNAWYMNADEEEKPMDWICRVAGQNYASPEDEEKKFVFDFDEELYKGDGQDGKGYNDATRDSSETELDMWEMITRAQKAQGSSSRGKLARAEDSVATMAPESLQEQERAQDQAQFQAISRDRESPVKSTGNENAGLGIISTLTTTERVVLPDGTTTTKIVLKKRFADGREETNESVHSTKGKSGPSGSGAGSVQGYSNERRKIANEDIGGKESKQEKKGWFWS